VPRLACPINVAAALNTGRRWVDPRGGRVGPDVRQEDHFNAARGMARDWALPAIDGHAMVCWMAAWTAWGLFILCSYTPPWDRGKDWVSW
jgi:hypothetical protein